MKKNFQKSSRSNNLPNQKIFKEIKVNKSEELLVFLLNNFPSLSRKPALEETPIRVPNVLNISTNKKAKTQIRKFPEKI